MFRSHTREAEFAWSYYEQLTLLSNYEALQKRIAEVYEPYHPIVECYSREVQRRISPITQDFIDKCPETAGENVALLKNAMELWRAASTTSDAVAPILYHYSWHLFNAFFVYTFFRWEPKHAMSHGIRILSNTLSEDVRNIKIGFQREGKDGNTNGLFQRLMDTWTLLGSYSAWAPYLPTFRDNMLIFTPNSSSVLKNNSMSVEQLLSFDIASFEKKVASNREKEIIRCFSMPSILMLNESIQAFLVAVVASSLARYRPTIWNMVLLGGVPEEARLASFSRSSFIRYTIGLPNTTGLLYQVQRLFQAMIDNRYEIRTYLGSLRNFLA